MSQDYANILKQAMDLHIGNKYGHASPPQPYLTPFGIKTLDALLGGGVPTSGPISISSTPETGKSTLSLQFASSFQRTHAEGVVLYINIEEAAGGDSTSSVANVTIQDPDKFVTYYDIHDRIKSFNIDPTRFLNKPVELNVKEVFELITEMVTIKRNLQTKTGKEVKMLIIWDSIAATPSSKDADADSPNEIIGFKARELTLGLSKIKQVISMERIAFIIIDQVRANMKIDANRFQAAMQEKSVGDFGNYKAATAVSALQHHLRQWLFLSKSAQLKPSDPLGKLNCPTV